MYVPSGEDTYKLRVRNNHATETTWHTFALTPWVWKWHPFVWHVSNNSVHIIFHLTYLTFCWSIRRRPGIVFVVSINKITSMVIQNSSDACNSDSAPSTIYSFRVLLIRWLSSMIVSLFRTCDSNCFQR